jgi:predicted kinase
VRIVVSGAPGTGKSTVAAQLAAHFDVPLLSLDVIKERLADTLGLGDEDWSIRLGDAAAEILFTLAAQFPSVVVEGWWRRERRERAGREFAGWDEVFCHCDPAVAAARAQARVANGRHPIHRDVINPEILGAVAETVEAVTPLQLGGAIVAVDTDGSTPVAAIVQQLRTQ